MACNTGAISDERRRADIRAAIAVTAHRELLTPQRFCYTRLQKWLKMQPCAFLFRTIRRRAGRFDRRLCKSPLQN
jgi:hypothetical protein